jgi:hypothetical protein
MVSRLNADSGELIGRVPRDIPVGDLIPAADLDDDDLLEIREGRLATTFIFSERASATTLEKIRATGRSDGNRDN